MGAVNKGADALGVYLTGGASNSDPAASLGGARSSHRVRGLGAILATPIPAVRFDDVFPNNGVGTGTLEVNAAGALVYTPPGAVAGSPVAIAAGESKLVSGADPTKAVRVYREAGLRMGDLATRVSTLKLVLALNGVFAQHNVTSAQRIAGVVTYRAFALAPNGLTGVLNVRVWLPVVGGAQASWSIASEAPVAGAVQTIANELAAPTGLSWSAPAAEGSALTIPVIVAGSFVAIWLRKTFPASGTVSLQENVKLAIKFKGAL